MLTINIVHLANSAIQKILAINKHNSKLKDRSIEMPNAPYSHRYAQFKKITNKNK